MYVGDDAMRRAPHVAKPVLSRRELAEVLHRTWYLSSNNQNAIGPAFRADCHIATSNRIKKKNPWYQQTFQVENMIALGKLSNSAAW